VLALNTSELKYHKYLMNMKRRIEFYWDYPPSAVRNGEQGRLKIDFTIDRDGSVGDIKVVKSSGYPPLDDAAVTAIRLASPFNPFPENFEIERVSIHGRFVYNLISYRGRGQP
ncbi:MAG: energy transducer TonB, partial [Thermodesulfobacteriota bacterium]